MKIVGTVMEAVDPKDDFVIVEFKKDPTKQHFIIYMERPFEKRLRKFESYIFTVKWRSIVMADVMGNKTYDTQLYTDDFPVPRDTLPDKKRFRN